jgi:Asp-tRNA(Asn)/Glu-tRNA(Gln) amidotransferase A subunit family amidase
MIDQRFSAHEFNVRGRNTEASRDLARSLRSTIAKELLADVRALGQKVVASLNAVGHSVSEVNFEVDQDGLAAVTFIDCSGGESREQHRLRFNLDLVVSVGFPGYEE